MTFDLDLSFEIMIQSAEGAKSHKEFEFPYPEISGLDKNQADFPILYLMPVETKKKDPTNSDFHMGDRYWRKGVDLIKAVASDAILFYKTLADSQRAEEFAKEFSSLAEKFTSKWKERESI